MGADGEEEVEATLMNPDNCLMAIDELQNVKVPTYFTFPGRNGKYSDLSQAALANNLVRDNRL